jgi:hypothetical protein
MGEWEKEVGYNKIATKPNCDGCGEPAVYGKIQSFPRIGFSECLISCWPKTFLTQEEKYRWDGTNFAVEGFPEENFFRDERKETTRGYECQSVEVCEAVLADSQPEFANEWDEVEDCNVQFSSITTISFPYNGDFSVCSDPADEEDGVAQCSSDELICTSTESAREYKESNGSGSNEFFNGFVLSNEETYDVLASRAAGSASCENPYWGSVPFSADPYLYPLAQGNFNPWDCRFCNGLCPDQPGGPGVGNFYPQGIFRGQFHKGCVRFHWGITGIETGLNPVARAAKYKIVIPYDAALPATQLDVTWQVVCRANKGAITTNGETFSNANPDSTNENEEDRENEKEGDDSFFVPGEFAETSESKEIWRKTIELTGSAMDAPQDFKGSLKENHASWNDFGYSIINNTLQVTGVAVAENDETRAVYKFVVLGATEGTVTWDVENLDANGNLVSTENKTATIGSNGETATEFLQSARVVNVVVTVDGVDQSRTEGPGGWMLNAKIRTGLWGYAELTDPSDPPLFYTRRITTYEHIIDGGSGSCNGCPDTVLQLRETEETTERLHEGQFISGVTKDESTDGNITLRWGREVYAEEPPGQPHSKPTGRPDFFYPKGCHNPDPDFSEPADDPYIETVKENGKKKYVIEDEAVSENTRICGVLLPSEPDPKGVIIQKNVGTEEEPEWVPEITNRAAVTENEEDSTSIQRLRPQATNFGPPDDCFDYGDRIRSGGPGPQIVADQSARLSMVLWDGEPAGTSDCVDGATIGAKIHQLSDNTFWEVVVSKITELPPEHCATLTAEYWRQLRYKSTPEQFMHTSRGDCTYWIENIEATRCHPQEEETE